MKTFTIEKQITLNALTERVFSALTDSQDIPKYFPLISVESPWVEGAEILYKGEINGEPFTDFGVIEKLKAPSEFRYRYWSDNHGTERTEENHLTIQYHLKAVGQGTVLSVKQSNIKSPEMYELMNGQVWDFLLNSFKEFIEESH